MGRCSYTWEEWDEEKIKLVKKCCQKETWKGSDEFCIFHDPSPEKNVDFFRKMIEEQIEAETEKYNFIGYCFPEKWDSFASRKFGVNANFRNATFQDANFEGVTFQDADFERTTFQSTAYFGRTTFQGAAKFGKATFQDASFGEDTFQDANFEKATFQDANFEGVTFKSTANFRGATFQDADFRGATFQDVTFEGVTFQDADFGKAVFRNTAYFLNASFQFAYFRKTTFKNADFGEATFKSTADFGEATFQDAYFEKAVFRGIAYFFRATFQDADFGEATFQGNANLKGATFQKADFGEATFQKADFGEATFQKADFGEATFQKADFGEATFQKADFGEATFQGNVHFSRATFQDADFGRTNFRGTANFRETVHQDADFRGATFQDADFGRTKFQKADFRGATFQDADFREVTFEKKLEFASDRVKRIDFRDAEFLSRSKVTANLKEALYQGAFIENIAFIDCRWPEDYIIYEEKQMNNKETNISFSQLETIYRDLKQNMQSHGDYVRAGEFYYREMEMRRRDISLKKMNRWWFEIYRFLAGYGEKPFLVVRNSFLVILLAAILFFFCGVVRVGAELPLQESPDIINYSIHSLCLNTETLKDFGYCLYYSIVTFTTLGYGDIHPLGSSHMLASAEALIGAFFMALFVVVFARKMMR